MSGGFDADRVYFYEPRPTVATRPPDGAATLADTVRTLVLLDVQRPATHQQLVGMTANGDTIVEYVCYHHQGEHTT